MRRGAKVPTKLLIKAVFAASLSSVLIFVLYALRGILEPWSAVYGVVAVLVSTAFFLRPYLKDVAALTRYVNAISMDMKIDPPTISLLGTIGELSQAVGRLHRSWGLKKQQMEAAIAEREILVDTIPDILLMTNEEERIVQSNGAARHAFGQKLAGKALAELIPSPELQKTMQEVLVSFKGQAIEFGFEHRDQMTYFRARIDRFPIHSPGGIALIITLHDITELKNMEQMRADFVANASHEIRTPLASLIGFIETLQGPAKDDAEAREQFLKIMSEQAARMSQLVNDLLSLSKLEMSADIMPNHAVDVAHLIKKVAGNAVWMMRGKQIQIVLEVPENLPLIRGDQNEVYQVIENLVGNAIKYGRDDGTVTISAWLTHKPPNDNHFYNVRHAVAISVKDQGEGIPKAHLSRLTERFYRVSGTNQKKVSGTGLGLAIVKHILNRHRAAMQIESTIGVGSTFTVFFHLKQQDKGAVAEGEESVEA